jgi:hypothetical protein
MCTSCHGRACLFAILAMGYGGVLNEALRDGLIKRSISDRPGSRRPSGVAEELITFTDAGRKRLGPTD